ncbi:hypothetical protein ACFL6E_05105 [Candidatus Neomarinimicrobiota bacterium]
MIVLPATFQDSQLSPLKIIGIGGTGGIWLNSAIAKGIIPTENSIFIDTDATALADSCASIRIHAGKNLSLKEGTLGNVDKGLQAWNEIWIPVLASLGDSREIIVIAGLGGGTGSAIVPIVLRLLRDFNIYSICIVSKPFRFEGENRHKCADWALRLLGLHGDRLMVIHYQELLSPIARSLRFSEALSILDEIALSQIDGCC